MSDPRRGSSEHGGRDAAVGDQVAGILARPFTWVVVQDESGRFSAKIEELPGCATDGDTREEAMRNLADAAHDWVEAALEDGVPIPEPRSGASASGRFLVRLPKRLHRQLQAAAEREGVSLNSLVSTVLAQYVGAGQITPAVVQQTADSLAASVLKDEALSRAATEFAWYLEKSLRSFRLSPPATSRYRWLTGISSESGDLDVLTFSRGEVTSGFATIARCGKKAFLKVTEAPVEYGRTSVRSDAGSPTKDEGPSHGRT